MPEYEIYQHAFGPRPLTLNMQVAASRFGAADIGRHHFNAARAAIASYHNQIAAGATEQTAYRLAMEAANSFVSDPEPGSAITPLDIALAGGEDRELLFEIAATDHSAARNAGRELDSAEYAVRDYQRRTTGPAAAGIEVEAVTQAVVGHIGDQMWTEQDHTHAWYSDQVAQILDDYPTAGPIPGSPLVLGYDEHDRGRPLREDDIARQARVTEAEITSRRHQHEAAADVATWALGEHLLTAEAPEPKQAATRRSDDVADTTAMDDKDLAKAERAEANDRIADWFTIDAESTQDTEWLAEHGAEVADYESWRAEPNRAADWFDGVAAYAYDAEWLAEYRAEAADYYSQHNIELRADAAAGGLPYKGPPPPEADECYQAGTTGEVADAVETARNAVDHAERSQQAAAEMQQTAVRVAEQARAAEVNAREAAAARTIEPGLERG